MESPPDVGMTLGVLSILYIARDSYPDESFAGVEKGYCLEIFPGQLVEAYRLQCDALLLSFC
ncbi:uncharacterized protein J3R85_015955 [Psidium guajava]|nr:uncharacterized protein J3R85_015955 [Psidium guajava]